MNDRAHASHPLYSDLPTEIERVDSLAELALDMRWSWNHGSDEMWRLIDPGLWDATANPWVLLRTVSRNQIERALADPTFRKKLDPNCFH
jgi:starch phosphorylase